MSSFLPVRRACSRTVDVVVIVAAVALAVGTGACGGIVAAPMSTEGPADSAVSTRDAPADTARADTTPPPDDVVDAPPVDDSILPACANKCLYVDRSNPGNFAIRASSCVCSACTACNGSELCGADPLPTAACVRCVEGLFGPTGACTNDPFFKSACATDEACSMAASCLRSCPTQ
jgi:hypothetical protein